jgi:DNA-binding transcriptional LysR family regulator
MNLKQIQSFVAIFEEGGFSRAAERLHASQPGLSAQIKQLENDLGDSLFERSVEGVTPTPAGQHFYQHALAILRQIQVARQDMGEIRGEISGAIRLGIIPSALRGLTPSLLPRFAADHPQIRITLKEAYSDSLTNWVRTGELDFAVVIEPSGLEGLKTERLTKESMVLISGRAMGLSPWHPISLVGAQPLKLIAPSVGNSLRISLDHRIRSGELPVANLLEMDSVHGSIEFIRNSDWATILPYTAVSAEAEAPDLCLNPIVAPDIPADFFLIHQVQSPLSFPARAFVEVMGEEFKRIDESWRANASRYQPLKKSSGRRGREAFDRDNAGD